MDLYVASWEEGGGKTTLGAGVGRSLKQSGLRVGYLTVAGSGAGEDANFMKLALGLEEPVDLIAPQAGGSAAEARGKELGAKVKDARDALAAGKDLVIIEDAGAMCKDEQAAEATMQKAQAFGARVIVLVNYSEKMQVDRVAASLKRFGECLLGVVINRIPKNRMENARTQLAGVLERQGVKILGLLPEDRVLFGVTVGELAEKLQAEAVCCQDRLGQLVQNMMIGVMTADSGKDYFERKDHKAVITRGERPDMQLAALGTPTVGLILTGGKGPIPQVKAWAEEKHVPILVTKGDTLATASEVENAFLGARFRHEAKLARLEEILSSALDFSALLSGMGMSG